MTIGRSLCRVAIYGGICFGASVLLPELAIPVAFLSTEKGQDILTKVGEMISDVTAGNTANAIDNFDRSRGSDYVRLENEDLIRVCGKAIAQIIHLAAQNSNNPYSKHLKMIAAKATENWVELARFEFAQSKYKQLTEGEIPLIITPTEEGLTQAKILTVEEWRNILAKLDLKAVDSAKGVDLPSYIRQDVAELLQKEFPRVLREALKQDFKADGKAFAGLMIQLITVIGQQVAQQGEIALISLAKLEQIEQQLTGTEQEIQELFIDISDRMQTGFEQLCHEFGLLETNINKNLQTIRESLVEIKEDTTVIRQNTTEIKESLASMQDEVSELRQDIKSLNQPHPRETTEEKLLKALLNLDYDKQANLFKEFVENHQIGACLVHGSCESAPRWLLNRLIRNVPNGNTSNYVKQIKFSRRINTSSLERLFQEISRKICRVQTSSVAAIYEKILEVWQSQTVILIFENTQEVEESYLEAFLQEFWQPLAELASQKGTTDKNKSLLLFLLDEDGYTNDWNITYTQDPTSELIPKTMIKFMEIQPIKPRQLSSWLELDICARNLLQYSDRLVDEVFRESQNGLHQYILEKICCLCQIEWEDYVSTWMKY
ncbi:MULTISPECIES: hypothetical protein [Limnospira]|uniref:Inactive STAND domain-containing protein n=1 Tax=Limnospira indica PCC 8005 TaxID=376219 RepID=A0A9P1KBE5_9CYAN|nr:hypothetical protein [Limnospira indica]CDM92921.1 conserved protein of unknown function [Limnospira indica PCC 8005]